MWKFGLGVSRPISAGFRQRLPDPVAETPAAGCSYGMPEAHHRRMSTFSSGRSSGGQRSVFASLLAPVVLVAVAGLVGWLILVSIKWLFVTLMIAFGVALIIVPFVAGRRILGSSTGDVRARRTAQLATAVALGVALIVLGIVVAHHGWLLIVVPAVVVLVGHLIGRFGVWRAGRRARRAGYARS
jgi:cation transport ATPase